MRCAVLAAIMALASAGCAPTRTGSEVARAESGATGGALALVPEVRAEPAEFVLADHRECRIVFSVRNSSRRLARLDFPTAQHLEVRLRGPDGRSLSLWSEDRSFAPEASAVAINPRERLEFEAAVPTRDMVAGRVYTAEAVMPGYPETAASANLHPR